MPRRPEKNGINESEPLGRRARPAEGGQLRHLVHALTVGQCNRHTKWPNTSALAAILILGLLSGCSATSGRISDLEKVMAALGPSELFAGLEAENEWMIVGSADEDQASMVIDEGLPVVQIRAGSDDLIMGRRVDQHLLATPFLTWSWKMSPHQGQYHPVRLIVGFANIPTPVGDRRQTLRRIPRHARVLELMWNERALRRGVLDAPTPDDRTPARYTIRGGEEALGKRWDEGIDLISLHDRAWPGVSTRDTRVLFVAVRAAPYQGKGTPPAGLFSDIRLIR